MYFLLQLSNLSYSYSPHSNERKDFFCRFFKICHKEALGGQPNRRRGGGGGSGDCQMGYIMCRFIGYGVKAAKSRTGYRNQRATLG